VYRTSKLSLRRDLLQSRISLLMCRILIHLHWEKAVLLREASVNSKIILFKPTKYKSYPTLKVSSKLKYQLTTNNKQLQSTDHNSPALLAGNLLILSRKEDHHHLTSATMNMESKKNELFSIETFMKSAAKST
jgi:hypothetical protein